MPSTDSVTLSDDQLRMLLTLGLARRVRGYVIGDADRIADDVAARVLGDLARLGVTLSGVLTVRLDAEKRRDDGREPDADGGGGDG